MDQPSGAWDALLTKEYLDLRLDALRGDLRTEIAGVRTELADIRTQLARQTTSLLKWLVPTIFGGFTAVGVIAAISADARKSSFGLDVVEHMFVY